MSCKKKPVVEPLDKETLITMQSVDLTVRNSTNGKLSYVFETPLLERYELAEEPYMEFRKGIKVVRYDDSTQMREADIIANYGKYIEHLDLWEARGNVIATNAKGQVLRTEQLFWDRKSDRIYSNVRSQVTDAEDVTVGDGFDTNSRFDDYTIRNPRGHMKVDTEPNRESSDSLLTQPHAEAGVPAADTLGRAALPADNPVPATPEQPALPAESPVTDSL
jgi:Protein of unknown function (DUF1239).